MYAFSYTKRRLEMSGWTILAWLFMAALMVLRVVIIIGFVYIVWALVLGLRGVLRDSRERTIHHS